jgi:transposase
MRHVSPQEAAALLSKPRTMLNERQTKIVEVLKRTRDFAMMRHLVLSFRSILRRGKVASLKRWLERAKAAGITAMNRFVSPTEEGLAGGRTCSSKRLEQWSNRGHINRLKTLKRQMYGKAGFELLRSRMLPLAA